MAHAARHALSTATPGNATHAGYTKVRRVAHACIASTVSSLGTSWRCIPLGMLPPVRHASPWGTPSPPPSSDHPPPPIADAALRRRCGDGALVAACPSRMRTRVQHAACSRSRSALGTSGLSGPLGPNVRPPRWASARAHSFERRSLGSDDLIDKVAANGTVRRKGTDTNRREPLLCCAAP